MNRRLIRYVFAACFFFLPLPQSANPLEATFKSATGASFPTQIILRSGRHRTVLDATGVASRKILFFNIYSIASYLETTENKTTAPAPASAIHAAAPAKQITINFERAIKAGKIREQFRDSYTSRATAAELAATRNSLESFLSFIRVGVVKGDRFAVRCLSGSHVLVFFKDKKVTEMTDLLFAQIFWSIWLGDEAVVDRAKLLERLTETKPGQTRKDF